MKKFYIDRPFDEILDEAKHAYEKQESLVEYLRKALSEYNKDYEISKYKEQAEDIRNHSLLIMSDREMKDEKAFREHHYELHNGGKYKSIANTYVYELTGTGLGCLIKIKCPICGEEKDITDTDSW